jgi:hypothetical protein
MRARYFSLLLAAGFCVRVVCNKLTPLSYFLLTSNNLHRFVTSYNNRATYEGKSIIIRNAVVFEFLLAALSFCAASPYVVSLSLFLRRFDVDRSVPSSLPCR